MPNPIVDKLKSVSEIDQKLIELANDDRVALLRKENNALRQKLRNKDAGLDIVMAALSQAYDEPLNVRVTAPKRFSKKEHTEEALLHLTDIHFGKETPTYNSTVAAERLLEVYEATTEITHLRRRYATIDRLHIALGGDMVEGEGGIFPGQSHQIDQDLVDQMIKFGPEIVANLILSLLQEYPEISVYGVPGNHGRERHNPSASRRNNADSVFYEIVRFIVRAANPEAAKRITWDLPFDRIQGEEWFSAFKVADRWGVLLVHGDQIMGQLGFPWYGYGKKVAGWASCLPPFDYVLAGHFHTQAAFDLHGRQVLSTGSPESDNTYAKENMASSGSPKQRLCFFNSRFGLLNDTPIYLEDRNPRN